MFHLQVKKSSIDKTSLCGRSKSEISLKARRYGYTVLNAELKSAKNSLIVPYTIFSKKGIEAEDRCQNLLTNGSYQKLEKNGRNSLLRIKSNSFSHQGMALLVHRVILRNLSTEISKAVTHVYIPGILGGEILQVSFFFVFLR